MTYTIVICHFLYTQLILSLSNSHVLRIDNMISVFKRRFHRTSAIHVFTIFTLIRRRQLRGTDASFVFAKPQKSSCRLWVYRPCERFPLQLVQQRRYRSLIQTNKYRHRLTTKLNVAIPPRRLNVGLITSCLFTIQYIYAII
jgi:hypothetical protein